MPSCDVVLPFNGAVGEVEARMGEIKAVLTEALTQVYSVLDRIDSTKILPQAEVPVVDATAPIPSIVAPSLTLPEPPAMVELGTLPGDGTNAIFGSTPIKPAFTAANIQPLTGVFPEPPPPFRPPTRPVKPTLTGDWAALAPPTEPSGELTLPERPDVPDLSTGRLEGLLGSEPEPPALTPMDLTPPLPPTLTSPTPPAALDTSLRPGTPPDLPTVTLPTAPVLTLPPAPSLATLNLPTVPTIDLGAILSQLQSWLAQIPAIPALGFTGDWWTEFTRAHAHNTASVTALVSQYAAFALTGPRLAELLSGHATGIPAAVEDALRARAYLDADLQASRDEQVAAEEWVARGFSLPAGPLLLRLDEIRQAGRMAKQKLRTDIFVQAAEWEIKNLQFAIQQGVAYEGDLRKHALALLDVDRQMATDSLGMLKAAAEVALAAFSAQLDMVKAKVAFLSDWTRLELAKIDLFKAQIEGEAAKGSLEKLKVDLYVSQLQTLEVTVGLYKAEIEGAIAQLQAGEQALKSYQTRASAYGEVVRAFAAEWSGFAEQVKAEGTKADVYNVQMQAFATQLKALSDAEKNKTDLYDAQIRAFAARIQAYGAVEQSKIGALDALTRSYVAELSNLSTIEQTRGQWYQAKMSAFAEKLRALAGADQSRAALYEAEVRAFSALIQGDQAVVGRYDAEVRAFAAMEQAIATRNQAVVSMADLEVKAGQIEATNLESKTRSFVAKIEHDKAFYDAQQELHRTNAQIYDVTVRGAATAANVQLEVTKTQLERARILLMEALERYKTEVQKATSDATIRAQLLDAAGRVTAQIASGGLAALSVSASIANNYTASNGSDCSTNYNYSL